MKQRVAVSVLIVVIITEMVGLFGLIYHRRCFRIQKESYNKLLDQCYEEYADIQQIRQQLYYHEFIVNSMIFPNPMVKAEDQKSRVLDTELQLRKQIIVHGELLQKFHDDSEKTRLFRQVNDDVLNYLNMNTVVTELMDTATIDEITSYIRNNIIPLTKRVEASTNALSDLSSVQMRQIREKIDRDLMRSEIVSFLCILLMVFSILMCIYYTHTIISNLESDRDVMKSKAEQNEQKVNDIQQQIIIGMAELVEKRSGETGQHVKRTRHFVSLILENAKRHGKWPEILTDEFIDNVTRAAPLHDLGKIAISDAILNKPGKLTPEEFEIMKTHASNGGVIIHQILDGVEDTDYLNTACDIATCHHEKWNGTGYPKGLKANQIPLSARIMAVADVFDALVSERCYKKAMSYEDAFALIKSEAGKHFDPEIVELFMELQNEITNEK